MKTSRVNHRMKIINKQKLFSVSCDFSIEPRRTFIWVLLVKNKSLKTISFNYFCDKNIGQEILCDIKETCCAIKNYLSLLNVDNDVWNEQQRNWVIITLKCHHRVFISNAEWAEENCENSGASKSDESPRHSSGYFKRTKFRQIFEPTKYSSGEIKIWQLFNCLHVWTFVNDQVESQ